MFLSDQRCNQQIDQLDADEGSNQAAGAVDPQELRDALTYSRLQRVRENDDAQDITVDANGERCCSQFRDSVSDHLKVRWHRRMELIDGVSNDRVHCTFADDPTVHKVDSAHAGLRRKVQSLRLVETRHWLSASRRAARDDGSALRRRIEIGCKKRGLNQVPLLEAMNRNEIIRFAIAGGNRSGLVEDQRLDIRRIARFYRR